jgi:ribosomal-protein-alanine N-acetyltransferase
MADDIAIEPATPADVDAIHRIEQASFPAPWRREFFISELAAEGRFNLVAKQIPDDVATQAEEVVGYLFAMWIFDELHVNKIAVHERLRRRGVADGLMERCFAFSRVNGIRTISLEVRQSNRGAQDFYRHLEFESTYVRPRYYPDGEAALVMTRVL